MADPKYRVKAGDADFGHTCPLCAGPKHLQSRKCRACHDEQWGDVHDRLAQTQDALWKLLRWAVGDDLWFAEVQQEVLEALRVRTDRVTVDERGVVVLIPQKPKKRTFRQAPPSKDHPWRKIRLEKAA